MRVKSPAEASTKEILSYSPDHRTLDSRGSPYGRSSRQWADKYSEEDAEDANERRVVRKVDRHVLPILCVAFFLQFMDKSILNYAAVMGIQKELGLRGNDFSWAGTAFNLSFVIADIPQGILLQKFPVHKVLAITILCWGIVTASTAAIQTRVQLLAIRTLLGLFEASIIASLIMITSAWYKRREGTARFGVWWSGLGWAQIIGGLVSFGAQHSSKKIQGWRLMFLVIGIVNMMVAVLIYRLPAGPDEAKWLKNSEKETAVRRLREDHAGTGAKVLRKRSVIEVLRDAQTWLLALISVLSMFASAVLALYSSTLINSFGYKPETAALLNMPSGVVSIVGCIGTTFIVARGWPRWAGMMIASTIAALGALLLVVLPAKHQIGQLIGVYLVNAGPATFTLVLSTTASNYRGYTRKIAAGSLIAMSFGVGNIISPQTYQAHDAPRYLPAKITLLVTTASINVFAIALRWLYGRRNAIADLNGEPAMSPYERASVVLSGANLEFADKTFRYVY